jgi:hypothetical protein
MGELFIFIFFLDTHLLAKLLKDQNGYIVWLTDCLIASATSGEDVSSSGFSFPFRVGPENAITMDELHTSYKSWLDVRGRHHDLHYKSIDLFHKALRSIAPNCIPENAAETAVSFNLDWYEFERGMLKNILGLDPFDADTIENSPFRRVCVCKIFKKVCNT